MTIIEKLDNAVASMNLPSYPEFFEGDGKTEYIVYDGMQDTSDIHGDNRPDVEINFGRVHLFVLNNPQQKKNKYRRLLREAGFCISSTYEQYEPETGYTHFSFEYETYEIINTQEE